MIDRSGYLGLQLLYCTLVRALKGDVQKKREGGGRKGEGGKGSGGRRERRKERERRGRAERGGEEKRKEGETGAQWHNKIKTSLYPRVMFRGMGIMGACPLRGITN